MQTKVEQDFIALKSWHILEVLGPEYFEFC